jgi:hypothetical protein
VAISFGFLNDFAFYPGIELRSDRKNVMKKLSMMMAASMLISMISLSQTTKDNIEKLSKDPKTAENAAKADVYILNNRKLICDTIAKQPSNPPASKHIKKKKQRRKR